MSSERHPALRVSDAEREATVAALGHHHAAGRLTFDEFSERLDRAYDARTAAELAELTDDLPALAAPTPEGERPRWIVSVMSGDERTPEVAVGEFRIVDFMGGSELDLRHARFPTGEVTITAVAIMGGSTIWVPEGARVEMDGFAIMGGNSNRVKEPRPDGPVIRVRAYTLMGGIDVKTGARRRDRKRALPPPG